MLWRSWLFWKCRTISPEYAGSVATDSLTERYGTRQPPVLSVIHVTGNPNARFAADGFLRRPSASFAFGCRASMSFLYRSAFLLCLLAAFGCSPRPIEGVYAFRSNEVEETLELRPGGEFRQQVTIDGTIYSATGQWSLASRDLKLRGQFLVRFDTSAGRTLKPPREYSLYSGYWDASHGRISYSAEYDAQYFVKRTP